MNSENKNFVLIDKGVKIPNELLCLVYMSSQRIINSCGITFAYIRISSKFIAIYFNLKRGPTVIYMDSHEEFPYFVRYGGLEKIGHVQNK